MDIERIGDIWTIRCTYCDHKIATMNNYSLRPIKEEEEANSEPRGTTTESSEI